MLFAPPIHVQTGFQPPKLSRNIAKQDRVKKGTLETVAIACGIAIIAGLVVLFAFMAPAMLGFLAFIFIGGFIYFLPSIVSERRKKRNAGAILMLNLFLGWTFLGWVVALVWACTED